MARFFITQENIQDDKIFIYEQDHLHLSKSLRMKISEKIVASDEELEYNCIIDKICDNHTECKILSKNLISTEPFLKIYVYISVTKGDKLDLVAQKVTELGAFEIIPFSSKRSIVKFDDKSMVKRKDRLQKIVLEASKQSGRGIVPSVSDFLNVDSVIEDTKDKDLRVVLYENEQNLSLKDVIHNKKFDNIAIIIGPEGGFDETEILKFTQNDIKVVTLGKRILRAETAPIACVSAIMYETDNLN